MGHLGYLARSAAASVMDSPIPAARANAVAQLACRAAANNGHSAVAAAVAVAAVLVTATEQIVGRYGDDGTEFASFHTDRPKEARS